MSTPAPVPMGEVAVEFMDSPIEVVIDDFSVEVVPSEKEVDILEVIVEGPQGATGPKGDTGDAGPEGGFYEYTRVHAYDAWVVEHNLGRTPAAVRVVDTEGNEHEPLVTDLSPNVTQLGFTKPIAGTAWLS